MRSRFKHLRPMIRTITGLTGTYTDLLHKLYIQLKLYNSQNVQEHRTGINQQTKLVNIN